jgi:hypothetical protein
MNPKFSRVLLRGHNLEQNGRSRSRRFFTKTGTTIAGLIAAIVLAVAAAGGSYAYLSQSAVAMPSTTVTSGTASLAVVSPLALPDTKMYPGLTLRSAAKVTNTGDVSLALRAAGLTGPSASTTFSQALTITVAVAPDATQCTNGTVTPSWTGTFAAASTASLSSTLAVGSSAFICVSVTLPANAPSGSQGQSALNFGLLIDGTQA